MISLTGKARGVSIHLLVDSMQTKEKSGAVRERERNDKLNLVMSFTRQEWNQEYCLLANGIKRRK